MGHAQVKKILVTGATGYIGSSLVAKLLSLGHEVTGLTRSLERARGLPSSFQSVSWVEGDLCSPQGWVGHLKGKDIVYHLAGQTVMSVANANPEKDRQINCDSLPVILDFLVAQSPRTRLILASTVTVEASDVPTNAYDLHKITSENILKSSSLPFVILRLANVYGPSLSHSKEGRGILNAFARLALQGKPLTIYGSGAWNRDYIYIEDVVDAFVKAGVTESPNALGQCVSIVSGKGTPFVQAVEMLCQLAFKKTGKSTLLIHDYEKSLSEIETRSFTGDPSAASSVLGWAAQTSLEQGLEALLN